MDFFLRPLKLNFVISWVAKYNTAYQLGCYFILFYFFQREIDKNKHDNSGTVNRTYLLGAVRLMK